jgi:hypothetical protein
MNPDSAVRPWLLSVGKQFGINEAHNHRWADASTRPQVRYFTYKVLSSVPDNDTAFRDNKSDGYAAIWKQWKSHKTTVEIYLHRELNGVEILSQCALAAQCVEPIKKHFNKSTCSFLKITDDGITDETPGELDLSDSCYTDKIKQKMTVVFNDTIGVEIRQENAVVETLDISLGL